MFGLVLAALYVAFTMVTSGTSLEVAFVATLPFLWWWHIAWLSVIAVFALGVFLVGIIAMMGCKSGAERGVGAAISFVGVPILCIMMAFTACLFLGGVHCMDQATHSYNVDSVDVEANPGPALLPYDMWDKQLFWVGAGLYGLGVLGSK
jgi:hypothetical protein